MSVRGSRRGLCVASLVLAEYLSKRTGIERFHRAEDCGRIEAIAENCSGVMPMPSFIQALREQHKVTLNLSGARTIPEFDASSGFWRYGGKATRALLNLEETGEEEIICKLPAQYMDGNIRLGQLNLSSLRLPAVVGFYLMCSTAEDSSWKLLDVSWVLAFRLTKRAVAGMLRQFQGQSLSSIGFDYDPHSGLLTATTRLHQVDCAYLSAGLLMNQEPTDQIGIGLHTYGEATDAIQRVIHCAPATAEMGA